MKVLLFQGPLFILIPFCYIAYFTSSAFTAAPVKKQRPIPCRGKEGDDRWFVHLWKVKHFEVF